MTLIENHIIVQVLYFLAYSLYNNNKIPGVILQVGSREGGVYAAYPYLEKNDIEFFSVRPSAQVKHFKNQACKVNTITKKSY